jgi:prepilin-type N-terminal cleavage/methylation domain-containing protein/prepilin-type processing-associated H-X9-DG protein
MKTKPVRFHNPSQSGFTLIELLTVVVILGILVGLVFAGARKAIEITELAKCTSNLRSTTGLILLYATDHDNTLPPQSYQLAGDGNPNTWWKLLTREGYTGTDRRVMQCPTYIKHYGFEQKDWYYTFTMNSDMDGDSKYNTSKTKLHQFDKPASTVFLFDGIDASWEAENAPGYNHYRINSDKVGNYHDGGHNRSYLDGHVEFISKERIAAANAQPSGD